MTRDDARDRLALLGAGVMGSAILQAALQAGRDPGSVSVSTLDESSARRWREAGVTVAGNDEAVRDATIVIVAVKPPAVPAVLAEAAGHLAGGAVVASVAAGVPTAALEAHLPEGTPVVRVMPNTPALVGEGMAALSPGRHCTDDHLVAVRGLLEHAGRVVVVPEAEQDAVTAVSGSGPAYVFAVAEAMIEGGVLLGLPRPTATELTAQTLYGAAVLLRDGDERHPGRLREQVTSPGGTTAAALREFDRHGLRSAIVAGMEACRDRSRELGG